MENHVISKQDHASLARKYYASAIGNLIRMGHCAPTVMKTLLDISSADKEWLVRLSAGMPGGIGNTGHECGGVTSSLVMLGTQFSLRKGNGGLPEILDRGHALCQNFASCHHTLKCKEIRGNDHFPRHCIPPVLRSPGMLMKPKWYHGSPIPVGVRAGFTQVVHSPGREQFPLRQGSAPPPRLQLRK
jgi:hypothetical protein